MTDIALEIKTLSRALEKFGLDATSVSKLLANLTDPPTSLYFSSHDEVTLDEIRLAVGFDGDVAAMMLYPGQGRTWNSLDPSEQKQAERRWLELMAPDDLSVVERGRPPLIDSALVLWTSRALAEALGQPNLKITRLVATDDLGVERSGPPTGPQFRALTAALNIINAYLIRKIIALGILAVASPVDDFDQPRHAEAIAQVVNLDRDLGKGHSARIFSDICRKNGLGRTAAHVAERPQEFRWAVMYCKKQRRAHVAEAKAR